MSNLQDLRVLSHGKITDLTSGFKPGFAFSVYVRPKDISMDADVVMDCRCLCDETATVLPVPLYNWTPAAIVEIAPNAISLVDYDVYWGAGNPNI